MCVCCCVSVSGGVLRVTTVAVPCWIGKHFFVCFVLVTKRKECKRVCEESCEERGVCLFLFQVQGISKSGFQYGKFANNMFSILKLLLTVPKMAKKPLLSNMKIWEKMAIFETTAKNSVLVRWVPGTHLQYEKKMKKFDLNQ